MIICRQQCDHVINLIFMRLQLLSILILVSSCDNSNYNNSEKVEHATQGTFNSGKNQIHSNRITDTIAYVGTMNYSLIPFRIDTAYRDTVFVRSDPDSVTFIY